MNGAWLASEALLTGGAALLFALVFVFGRRFHPLKAFTADRPVALRCTGATAGGRRRT